MTTELFVDGAWRKASGETRPVVNPATGTTLEHLGCATPEDVDRAVRAARQALDAGPWGSMSGFERRRRLLAFAREVREAAEAIGAVESDDMGMPRAFVQGGVTAAADGLEYFAGWADKVGGEVLPGPDASALNYTVRHPVGVVGAIVPWNSPTYLALQKLGPALAAGCTVVLKPSEEAPLGPLQLAACAERAELPPGVVNVVTGTADAGAALVAHPGVDKVSFTGGTELGRRVAREAAARFARVALELGGKSANIVFADADLDAAALGSTLAVLLNTGQQCIAGSRLLVQRPVYDEFVRRVVETARGLKVGMPAEPGTMLGPLISERQLERVLGFVAEAGEAGTVVLGGERLGGELADGYFLGPTVVADVDRGSRLWNEEVFGPVLAVTPFDTAAEAVEVANDSRYGLAGGVWTSDLDTAHGVAGSIRTGTMWVNTYLDMSPAAPFGGFKESGVGREGGLPSVQEFTELTSVHVKLGELS